MTGNQLALKSAELLNDSILLTALNEQVENEQTKRLYRAVRDALAEASRDFPVEQKATVTAKDGVIPYSAVKPSGMINVRRVTKNDRDVPFSTDYLNIYVKHDGRYTVVYSADCFDVDLSKELPTVREVGTPMRAHLVSRNYCIMCGRLDEAAVYDSRYDEYAEALRLKRRAHIPARNFA